MLVITYSLNTQQLLAYHSPTHPLLLTLLYILSYLVFYLYKQWCVKEGKDLFQEMMRMSVRQREEHIDIKTVKVSEFR